MSNDFFTTKQVQMVRDLKHGRLRRLNLLEGSVRSGKTWISLVLWAAWVAQRPEDGSYLMVGKTLTALKRNCLDLLQSLVGEDVFLYSISTKTGRLFGRRVYLEGVNDARAESKIRGLTLHGAYCDELTLFTEDFFNMLLSRLSAPGAKLIATTNPDAPTHWLKTQWIDRAEKDDLDFQTTQFTIDDNTKLDAAYVTSIKREYTGVFYKRFILGQWVQAEGVVYDLFADDPESFIIDQAPRVQLATIGIDFGENKSATAFVCNGILPGMRGVVTLDEYYHTGKQTPKQLEDSFAAFVRRCKAKYPLYTIYCDSAQQTLVTGLRYTAVQECLGVEVVNAAKGPILDRIHLYCALMGRGSYQVMRHCTHVIEALQTAVWSDKSETKTERLDNGTTNIDSLDALEYSTEPFTEALLARR